MFAKNSPGISRRSFITLALAAGMGRTLRGAAANSAAARKGTSELHTVDAGTPEGLRELFRPSEERLPLLSAHRGGAGRGFPENCLATFEQTLRRTWSMLEIDLRYTKDGEIVLLHDPTLDRTTSGTGPVQDHTLAQLRQLRLKDREGNLTGHTIPTLDEAMQWARGRTILILDKKEVPVGDAVRAIARHRAESWAMVMAYSARDITECHALNPNIMMEVMLGTNERVQEFERTGVPWSHVIAFVGHTATPDAELCRKIRSRGASCMAGTSRNIDREFLTGRATNVDTLRPAYQAVLARGVDVIETDIPRELGPMLFGHQPVPTASAKFFHAPPAAPIAR